MGESKPRWESVMDEETSALLPGRASATDEPEVEDFQTVCRKVVYAITILTAVLVVLSTTMYVIYFQPQAPLVEFQGMDVREFSVSPMLDRTGVPTQGVSAKALVKIAFYNPSVLYEANVREVTGSLSFGRSIAHGTAEDVVVPRQWGSMIQLELDSISHGAGLVPLYGAAPLLLEQMNERGIIDLLVEFQLNSEFSMFYGLVRREYKTIVRCDVGFRLGNAEQTPAGSGGVILKKICSSVH